MKNKTPEKLPAELSEIAEKVGKFIEYWGFKEIEGKIWVHLLLSNRPLHAGELVERLGMSKGSVSLAVARLIKFDVIRVVDTKDWGTQYLTINQDVTSVIQGVLRQRERVLMADVLSSIKLLSGLEQEHLPGLSKKRVTYLENMTTKAQGVLDTLIFQDSELVSLFFGNAPDTD
jgi:DNA-binding transcriptional regulator GbsR (MarR family)